SAASSSRYLLARHQERGDQNGPQKDQQQHKPGPGMAKVNRITNPSHLGHPEPRIIRIAIDDSVVMLQPLKSTLFQSPHPNRETSGAHDNRCDDDSQSWSGNTKRVRWIPKRQEHSKNSSKNRNANLENDHQLPRQSRNRDSGIDRERTILSTS